MKASLKKRLGTWFLAAVLAFSIFSAALAAPGDLDHTFGGDGKVTTPFPLAGKVTTTMQGYDVPVAALQQPDGKMVVVGEIKIASFGFPDIGLARYNADGSLDTTFDGDGKAASTLVGGTFYYGIKPLDAALLSDNRIVVVGKAPTNEIDDTDDVFIALFKTDGTLDTSFSTDGYERFVDGSGSEEASAVVVQADNKIVIARNNFTLVRFNTNGTLDTSFGTAGSVSTACGADYLGCDIFDLAIQTVGGVSKIVTIGSALSLTTLGDFILMRHNLDGSLDTTFGTNGITSTNFGNMEVARAAAIQADGKILVVGTAYNSTANNSDFAVARYTADGVLDTAFSGDGKLTQAFVGEDVANAVAQQADGSILVFGCSDTGDSGKPELCHPDSYSGKMTMVRYDSSGAPDTSFGVGGTFIYNNQNVGTDLILQPGGRIVGIGYTVTSPAFFLIGLNNNGSFDNDFGVEFGVSDAKANAVALQADGKMVAAGYSTVDSSLNIEAFSLARYNANGSLDTSFGGDGKVTTSFEYQYTEAQAVAIQADGKIVTAGFTADWGSGQSNLALARYNTDGSLDTSFGTDGVVSAGAAGKAITTVSGMTIQPNGKIVLAGSASNSGENSVFMLTRYNANGTLDATFGTNGVTFTAFPAPAGINSIAVQSDGRIVAFGTTGEFPFGNINFALARFSADGVLDASFGTDGIVETDLGSGSYDEASSVAIQSNGKILASGNSGSDFALARYNADGSLDTSFDTDGLLTTDFDSGSDDSLSAMLIQPDGKILAAGSTYSGATGNGDWALVKYNADGSLDTSFNATGKLAINFNTSEFETANALALQPDGQIIAAGQTMYEFGAQQFEFALARVENALDCASAITVTTNADSGAGSLRQAIADVCPGGTITFASSLAGQTITLTSGQLSIGKSMTIDGGTNNITVSGNNASRVFSIPSNPTFHLSNLTVANGNAIADNGGGIYMDGLSDVTVTNSTFSGNHAGYGGGGIYNYVGNLTVTNSAFFDNHAATTGGGAIYNYYQSLTVINSSFSANHAAYGGGGIFSEGSLWVTNSTFSANGAGVEGSGIANLGTAELKNTIIANSASGSNCDKGTNFTDGGGNLDDGATCGFSAANGSLSNTNPLLGTFGNYDGNTNTFPLLPGSPAMDAGDSATCADAATVNDKDQRGVTRPAACDAGAFESQGFTFGSQTGSPQSAVINTDFATSLGLTVSSSYSEPVAGGQVTFTAPSAPGASLTGSPATIGSDGKVSVTAKADGTVGPYNVTASAAGVTTNMDFALTNLPACSPAITVANNLDSGAGSLRQAIADVCADGTITFDSLLAGQTIPLTSGELTIDKSMTVDGGTNDITVSGGGTSRVFHISAGVTFNMNDLTVADGFTSGMTSVDGGGLWADGRNTKVTTVGLSRVTFANNTSSGNGGGLRSYYSYLTLTDVTFKNNQANMGGGMSVTSGSAALTNLTFDGNQAVGPDAMCGGLIFGTISNPTLTNATFYNNTAQFGGGFCKMGMGGATLTNTTFKGNHADQNGGAIYGNGFTLRNGILWGNTATSGGAQISGTATVTDSVIQDGYTGGTNILTADPLLGSLGSFGGNTQTIPLLPGSSALDAGDDSACPAADQRGVTRPQGSHCDIGAYELEAYILTYTAGAHGSISGDSPQTIHKGADGSAVTAVPDTNYHFVSWSDGVLTASRTDTNVTGNITVTANFAIDTYTLTYTAGANGSITGISPQSVDHGASGTQVTAVADAHYHFVSWSDGVLTASRTDTNVTGNITVTANFAVDTYTLTYTAGAHGSITGTSPQTVDHGASGTQVTAVADANYHFVSWSDGVLTASRTDTNITGNITVTANFAVDTYTLTYTAGAHGSITGVSPQTVDHGASGTQVTAVADANYHFVGWSDGVLTASRTDTNVTGNITVTANFAQDEYTLTINSAHGTVTRTPDQATYHYGDVVTLGVTPDAGWSFRDWTPALTGNQVTITGHTTVTANYRQIPVITWANPAAINQGTPLSATQLNAAADVPGIFTYTPASGIYLSTGTHTLHVDFVPTDTASYTDASMEVSLTVNDHVIFADVPNGYWARSFVERLYLSQITGGCGSSPLIYCPNQGVTRAQLAVLLLRSKYGAPYLPPEVGASSGFNDVPTSHWAAAWVKQLAAEGITSGCGNGNFCPNQVVTREQLAVMLLRAEHGRAYTPPAATGMFSDVPVNYWAAAWIEQLAKEGISGGCGGGRFCPAKYVTRAEVAVFLVTAFDLP